MSRAARTVEHLRTTLDVLAVSARMRVSELLATPATLVLTVIQPTALLLILLLSLPDQSPQRTAHAVSGVLLTAFWGATVRGTGAVLARDRAQGVLARAVTGTKDARLVVLGKGLGAGLLSIGQISLALLAVLLLLRRPVSAHHPGWLAAGLLTALLSGAAVGMLIACLFVLTRHAMQISTMLIYGVYVLGGILIPPELLPAALRWLSYGISLHWLQEFLGAAAAGRVQPWPLAAAAGLTAIYALCGALLFQRVVTRARKEATLDVV
ncbi:ABC transporter permease [Streptomyces bambusae]|uniref:ABC transporter permease n=1 Tax=Streptomyces bambusae TaxID=1550616 RepID=UPI001CFEA4C7|nr:ABC transporter permease [Streptomyces bambusae]MCB5166985.1 ABC transporter permease [Streptomyces bambusae]